VTEVCNKKKEGIPFMIERTLYLKLLTGINTVKILLLVFHIKIYSYDSTSIFYSNVKKMQLIQFLYVFYLPRLLVIEKSFQLKNFSNIYITERNFLELHKNNIDL
jgi:hypothetical protein